MIIIKENKEVYTNFSEITINEVDITIEELEREYLEYYSIDNEVISRL